MKYILRFYSFFILSCMHSSFHRIFTLIPRAPLFTRTFKVPSLRCYQTITAQQSLQKSIQTLHVLTTINEYMAQQIKRAKKYTTDSIFYNRLIDNDPQAIRVLNGLIVHNHTIGQAILKPLPLLRALNKDNKEILEDLKTAQREYESSIRNLNISQYAHYDM